MAAGERNLDMRFRRGKAPEHLPKVDKKEDAPDSNPTGKAAFEKLKDVLPRIMALDLIDQVAPAKCCVCCCSKGLLKAKTEHLGVAAKLVASASDLDAMAAGERNLDMLRGWRAEVFGDEAKRLCQGEIGLVAKGRVVTTFELPK